jgi:lipopolysaccharide/colanic/teichoic acid biosynthesis glycosyltransferase
MKIKTITKLIFDLIVSLILLLPTLVLFLVIGLMIKVDSNGPILFKQQRYGRNNRPFLMYKFRTMSADAEKQQTDLMEKNEASGFLFKITLDPRQTRVGRVLRNLGIDEIPQLFNVLKGEMSLVGPRPLPVCDVDFDKLREQPDLYQKWEIRKQVRPGITGLWQLNPGDHSFNNMLELDEQYVNDFSLISDFKLIVRTVQLALSGVFPRLFSNPRDRLLKIKKHNA